MLNFKKHDENFVDFVLNSSSIQNSRVYRLLCGKGDTCDDGSLSIVVGQGENKNDEYYSCCSFAGELPDGITKDFYLASLQEGSYKGISRGLMGEKELDMLNKGDFVKGPIASSRTHLIELLAGEVISVEAFIRAYTGIGSACCDGHREDHFELYTEEDVACVRESLSKLDKDVLSFLYYCKNNIYSWNGEKFMELVAEAYGGVPKKIVVNKKNVRYYSHWNYAMKKFRDEKNKRFVVYSDCFNYRHLFPNVDIVDILHSATLQPEIVEYSEISFMEYYKKYLDVDFSMSDDVHAVAIVWYIDKMLSEVGHFAGYSKEGANNLIDRHIRYILLGYEHTEVSKTISRLFCCYVMDNYKDLLWYVNSKWVSNMDEDNFKMLVSYWDIMNGAYGISGVEYQNAFVELENSWVQAK